MFLYRNKFPLPNTAWILYVVHMLLKQISSYSFVLLLLSGNSKFPCGIPVICVYRYSFVLQRISVLRHRVVGTSSWYHHQQTFKIRLNDGVASASRHFVVNTFHYSATTVPSALNNISLITCDKEISDIHFGYAHAYSLL